MSETPRSFGSPRPLRNTIGRFPTRYLVVGLVIIAATGAVAQPSALAGDWAQILGPNRNGLSSETGLVDKWPSGGPKEVWRAPGGVGMSGLAIRDDWLVTLVQKEGKQFVVSMGAQDGKPRWEQAVAPEFTNPMGDGPRATPTIVGDRVYVFTGEGILVALDFEDGKPLWRHDVVKELGGQVAEYGMACSPLVEEGRVIVTAGAPNATVVAYDAPTGELAWKAGEDVAGYSSPAALKVGGRRQVVVYTGASVLGLAPDSGAILWRYPFETNFDCNIVTPLEINGDVFISSGENHGAALLKLKPKGKAFMVEEVWTSFGPKSVLRNEWQTSMLIDGFLYGMDNVGGAGPITHLTCVDAATGKRKWQKERFGKGNLIAADGKLLISTMKGELILAKASPKEYIELGRATVLSMTRQAPALANGLLYMRDDEEIVCLDLRASPSE